MCVKFVYIILLFRSQRYEEDLLNKDILFKFEELTIPGLEGNYDFCVSRDTGHRKSYAAQDTTRTQTTTIGDDGSDESRTGSISLPRKKRKKLGENQRSSVVIIKLLPVQSIYVLFIF